MLRAGLVMKEMMLTCQNTGPLTARDLSRFIYYLQIVYAGAMELRNDSAETLLTDREQFLKRFPPILQAQVSKRSADRLFQEELKERELLVTRLQLESPLVLGFQGWGTALAATALLLGGELTVAEGALQVNLPGLARATAKLMSACGLVSKAKGKPKRVQIRTAPGTHAAGLHELATHG